jgi:hypothetical protein
LCVVMLCVVMRVIVVGCWWGGSAVWLLVWRVGGLVGEGVTLGEKSTVGVGFSPRVTVPGSAAVRDLGWPGLGWAQKRVLAITFARRVVRRPPAHRRPRSGDHAAAQRSGATPGEMMAANGERPMAIDSGRPGTKSG